MGKKTSKKQTSKQPVGQIIFKVCLAGVLAGPRSPSIIAVALVPGIFFHQGSYLIIIHWKDEWESKWDNFTEFKSKGSFPWLEDKTFWS